VRIVSGSVKRRGGCANLLRFVAAASALGSTRTVGLYRELLDS
jgi:hypothetical protein